MDGLSSYDHWVIEGNFGTEADFLASLIGPKGDRGDSIIGPPGKDGISIKGDKGDPGDKGDSIQGPPGQDGDKGEPGDPGKDGEDGKPGQDGKDGDSAYKAWLDEGNEGSKALFLQGLRGNPGPKGSKGNKGDKGDDGESAYQLWLAKGNKGTEQEFLDEISRNAGRIAGVILGPTRVSGTVKSVSVASANGLAGIVVTPTTTPAITLRTTVTGILKGNGTAISAAIPGVDYLTSVSVDGQTVFGDGAGTPLFTQELYSSDATDLFYNDSYNNYLFTDENVGGPFVIDLQTGNSANRGFAAIESTNDGIIINIGSGTSLRDGGLNMTSGIYSSDFAGASIDVFVTQNDIYVIRSITGKWDWVS